MATDVARDCMQSLVDDDDDCTTSHRKRHSYYRVATRSRITGNILSHSRLGLIRDHSFGLFFSKGHSLAAVSTIPWCSYRDPTHNVIACDVQFGQNIDGWGNHNMHVVLNETLYGVKFHQGRC